MLLLLLWFLSYQDSGGEVTLTDAHIDECASLFACVCMCICVAECKRQYVARYKTTYRPQSEAHIYTHTHTHSHAQILTTLTHSLTHTRKQSECTGKNCGKLHEITKQRSAAQPLSIFRSHILLAVVVSATATATVVVIIGCLLLSPPERSTIVFMSLLFNCTHFRFRFGQELRSVFCPLPAWFYIPVVVLFCCLCCCCCDDQLPSNHAPPTQSTAETKR